MTDCAHHNTIHVVNPLEYWIGESVEVCVLCKMSRSHWEQGSSPWMRVPLCKLCLEPQEDEVEYCDKCSKRILEMKR